MRTSLRGAGIAAVGLGLLCASGVGLAGTITFDGSVGSGGPRSLGAVGGTYTIQAEAGSQAGSNLFHSFGTFDIDAGERALFVGPHSIQNVISRVTGGQPSIIDGALVSEVGQANFFFLNPAGVVFGPHATLDLPAALHVSSADQLEFADGGRYVAAPASATPPLLSVHSPVAFGFLGGAAGEIRFDGGRHRLGDGAALSITGGDLEFSATGIEVPGGRALMVAAGEATGRVPLTGQFSMDAGGGLSLSAGSALDLSSPEAGGGSGEVMVKAGTARLIGSAVSSINQGADVAGGGIAWQSKSLQLEEGAIQVGSEGSGAAGSVDLEVEGLLEINGGGVVSSESLGSGRGGAVTVHAGGIAIDGAGAPAGRVTGVTADALGSGDGGQLVVAAEGALAIRDGGRISTTTQHAGQGGRIEISAGSVRLDSAPEAGAKTGIFSDAFGPGSAGAIRLETTGHLDIWRGASLASNTEGSGRSGDLVVIAESATLAGKGAPHQTGIASNTRGAGDGGTVTLRVVDQLDMVDAVVGANAFSSGDAGEVTVSALNATIDGAGNPRSGVFSDTGYGSVAGESTGDSARVDIEVENLLIMRNQGGVGTNTYHTGNAGKVDVCAIDIWMESGSRIVSDTWGTLNPQEGRAGVVSLKVTNSVDLRDGATISSQSRGSGEAGVITIVSTQVVAEGSEGQRTGVFTEALGATHVNDGRGGLIWVEVDEGLELRGGATLSTDTRGSGDGGGVGVRAGGEVRLESGGAILTRAGEGSSGMAGLIQVEGDALLINGGDRQTGLFSRVRPEATGQVGDIKVVARTVEISGGGQIGVANESQVVAPSLRGARTIQLASEQLKVTRGGAVTSETRGRSAAGDIHLQSSGDIDLRGGRVASSSNSPDPQAGRVGAIAISGGGDLLLYGSTIETEGVNAGGGQVRLDAGGQLRVDGSTITTWVQSGSGGDIEFDSGIVTLRHGHIAARAPHGVGGNIHIRSDYFVGDTHTVIDASSRTGYHGATGIAPPLPDHQGSLGLPDPRFLDAEPWGVGGGSGLLPSLWCAGADGSTPPCGGGISSRL